MSIITCKIEDEAICIAYDSQVTCRNNKGALFNYDKVTKIDDIYVGCVGEVDESILFVDFVRENMPPDTAHDMQKYVLGFYAARSAICGSFINKEEQECGISSCMTAMLVINDKVFLIDGRVVMEIKTHHAIGSGEEFAYAILEYGGSAFDAARIACKLDLYCKEPVHEIRIEREWMQG